MADNYRTRLEFAKSILFARNYGRAEPLLRELHGRSPDEPEPMLWLSRCLRAVGKYGEAIDIARRLVRVRPDWATSHYTLSVAFNGAARWREGLASGLETLRLNPNHAEFFWPAASARYELAEFGRSLELARRGLSLDATHYLLRHHLSLSLAATGDQTGALDVIAQILREQPNDPGNLAAAGWTCWHLGRFDDAVRYFESAIAVDPMFPWQHEGLGLSLYGRRCFDAARTSLTEAARLDSAMVKGRIVLDRLARADDAGGDEALLTPDEICRLCAQSTTA